MSVKLRFYRIHLHVIIRNFDCIKLQICKPNLYWMFNLLLLILNRHIDKKN